MVRGARGFTLVETLVALTLMALVATMLFGGLRFGARSWDAVAAGAEGRGAAAAARSFLAARLSQVSETEGAAPAFDGAADTLNFTAPWTGGPVPAGRYRFALGRADGALMLAWRPVDKDRADLAGRRALLDGVAAVSLSYFGASEGGAPRWRRAWPQAFGAPELVRLEIAFEDGGRAWAPLVIRRAL